MLEIYYTCNISYYLPVGTRVGIDSPHPVVRHKRRLNGTEWGGPSDETGKTEAPCQSRCGTMK
jgi:hypothetical protein